MIYISVLISEPEEWMRASASAHSGLVQIPTQHLQDVGQASEAPKDGVVV